MTDHKPRKFKIGQKVVCQKQVDYNGNEHQLSKMYRGKGVGVVLGESDLKFEKYVVMIVQWPNGQKENVWCDWFVTTNAKQITLNGEKVYV